MMNQVTLERGETRIGLESLSPFQLSAKVYRKKNDSIFGEDIKPLADRKYSDFRQPWDNDFSKNESFSLNQKVNLAEGQIFRKSSHNLHHLNFECNKKVEYGFPINSNVSEPAHFFPSQQKFCINYSQFSNTPYIASSRLSNNFQIKKNASSKNFKNILEERQTNSNTLSNIDSPINSINSSKKSSSNIIFQIENTETAPKCQANLVGVQEKYNYPKKQFSNLTKYPENYVPNKNHTNGYNTNIDNKINESTVSNLTSRNLNNNGQYDVKPMNSILALNFSRTESMNNSTINFNHKSNNFIPSPFNSNYSIINNSNNIFLPSQPSSKKKLENCLSPFSPYLNKYQSPNYNTTNTISTRFSVKEENCLRKEGYINNVNRKYFSRKGSLNSLGVDNNLYNGVHRKSFPNDSELFIRNSDPFKNYLPFNNANNNFNKFNNKQTIMTNSHNENSEILTVKIKIDDKNTGDIELSVHRYADLFMVVKNFCSNNKISEDFIKPIIMKINETLKSIYKVYNTTVNKKDIDYLNFINTMFQEKIQSLKPNVDNCEPLNSVDLDITSISNISDGDDILAEEPEEKFKLNKTF